MKVTTLARLTSPLFLALFLAVTLSACGSKSNIDLKANPAAPAPVSQTDKPAPTDPNDPAQNPEKPEPLPPGTNLHSYRMVCEGTRDISTLISFQTTSTAQQAPYSFYVGSFEDPSKETTRANFNITRTYNPIPVPMAATDHLDVLFIGSKVNSETNLRLYFANVDTVYRIGNAADLGAQVAVSAATIQAANAMGLATANYGASDEGHYLILPTSNGFKIVSRDRAKTLGQLNVSATTAILPKIYEKQGVFTALSFNGHAFVPVLQKLSITSSSVSVVRSVALGASSGMATPLQIFDDSNFAWSETTSVGANAITIAKVDVTTGQVTRAVYKTPIRAAKIYPQIAVTRDDQGSMVNVAIESVSKAPSTDEDKVMEVDYAKIQPLMFSGASLEERLPISYPALSIYKVETKGLEGAFIVKTLFSTENSDELFGSFDSQYHYQMYTLRNSGLDGVTNYTCLHPQVTEEN